MDNSQGHDFAPYHTGKGFDPVVVDPAKKSPQEGITIGKGDGGQIAHNTTQETATSAPVDSGLMHN